MQETVTDYFLQALDLEQELIVKREELCYFQKFTKPLECEEGENAYIHSPAKNYEREVTEEMSALLAQKKRMKKVLLLLSKPQYKTVLQLRYFFGLTTDQIANRMNYTPRHVKRLQSLALKELEEKTRNQNMPWNVTAKACYTKKGGRNDTPRSITAGN